MKNKGQGRTGRVAGGRNDLQHVAGCFDNGGSCKAGVEKKKLLPESRIGLLFQSILLRTSTGAETNSGVGSRMRVDGRSVLKPGANGAGNGITANRDQQARN